MEWVRGIYTSSALQPLSSIPNLLLGNSKAVRSNAKPQLVPDPTVNNKMLIFQRKVKKVQKSLQNGQSSIGRDLTFTWK